LVAVIILYLISSQHLGVLTTSRKFVYCLTNNTVDCTAHHTSGHKNTSLLFSGFDSVGRFYFFSRICETVATMDVVFSMAAIAQHLQSPDKLSVCYFYVLFKARCL